MGLFRANIKNHPIRLTKLPSEEGWKPRSQSGPHCVCETVKFSFETLCTAVERFNYQVVQEFLCEFSFIMKLYK